MNMKKITDQIKTLEDSIAFMDSEREQLNISIVNHILNVDRDSSKVDPRDYEHYRRDLENVKGMNYVQDLMSSEISFLLTQINK